MSISVLGAGAFGTSLAIALARNCAPVTLWCRDADQANAMAQSRVSGQRLPGHALPDSLVVTADTGAFEAETALLAVPMQFLSGFLAELPERQQALVACCKGMDLSTGLGPVETIRKYRPLADAAILTGPSFAEDIARGLPTALVLAAGEQRLSEALQKQLTRPMLRLYRTTDITGAELGGALKNVVALAAGITIGAGLGDSARASVIARGFAEMQRFALAKGASSETLHGLAGLGDLVLTCTSRKSRNFTAGIALGQGQSVRAGTTIEGMSTTQAVTDEATRLGLDLPLFQTVSRVISDTLDIDTAVQTLMSRPVGVE